ncbi:MAG TPA: glycosyltransferase [Candidatus Saccharimonadales bacterium]|nr:glycosyltransferase [Candidatus Saccharimonadales bacterium]
MKILHVIRSVSATGGGPIEGIKQLASVDQSGGHEIEVASLDASDAPCTIGFPYPVHALGPGWRKYGYSNRLVPWLSENAHNYDVVIVNGIWQYHSFATWRALHEASTPYVVFTHGMLDPWFKKKYPLKHLKKLLYWSWGERRVLKDAGAVLFTCEEERLLARQSFRSYRCNEIVVNYGTSGPQGDPQVETDIFFQRYPELRGKRIAIFLGRLHEKKGCDLLIQAFAKVLAFDPDWHLLMCGPDQVGWQATLQYTAKELNLSERITWTGMVNGALKWGALRASEIFILPSHQENFGMGVAEALACSVPALISDKVNIWHEVQRDGAGIVGADDLEGTCATLRRWLKLSSEEKAAMRNQARKCFERNFEIHNAARTLISTLTAVAREWN